MLLEAYLLIGGVQALGSTPFLMNLFFGLPCHVVPVRKILFQLLCDNSPDIL